jgi:Ni,Fe-hydrogenase I large subunit
MAKLTGYEVDPISRIEGHLGVTLATGGTGFVTSAQVHGNLWRGFENFLIGRDVNDAITFVQRICGVCPIPHATASTFATESVMGVNEGYITFASGTDGFGVPKKAMHIRNLVYGSEFLMSHITHFYHLAAPSYIQGPPVAPWTPYFANGYYNAALRKPSTVTSAAPLPRQWKLDGGDATNTYSSSSWSAIITSYVKALRVRRLTFEAGALFAGRMPMTSSFVVGGVTVNHEEDLGSKCALFTKLMGEVGDFIVREYVPIVLTLGALYADFDNTANGGQGYGGGWGNFLAWGAFPDESDGLTIGGGTFVSGNPSTRVMFATNKATVKASGVPLVKANLVENISNSHYVSSGTWLSGGTFDTSGFAYPGDVFATIPDRSKDYSWLKAPRWKVAGVPTAMEVGPYARMVVNGMYPVDGTAIANNAKLGSTYLLYTKHGGTTGGLGLDPQMVAPDIAVGLLSDGLATLETSTGTIISADVKGLDKATIDAAYYASGTVISGTVANWIIGLKGGLSTIDRLRGRGLEALWLTTQMIGGPSKPAAGTGGAITFASGGSWIQKLDALPAADPTWRTPTVPYTAVTPAKGFGVSEAPRGALAHFIAQQGGKIVAYQCVVPTTWNAGPTDSNGVLGPMEKAMIGIPYNSGGSSTFTTQAGGVGTSVNSGVEALRVAQSFDPCIACSVH